jgi:hypothetical protein
MVEEYVLSTKDTHVFKRSDEGDFLYKRRDLKTFHPSFDLSLLHASYQFKSAIHMIREYIRLFLIFKVLTNVTIQDIRNIIFKYHLLCDENLKYYKNGYQPVLIERYLMIGN